MENINKMQSELKNDLPKETAIDPVTDNMKSKLDSYFSNPEKDGNDIQTRLYEIQKTKNAEQYNLIFTEIKKQKELTKELVSLSLQVSLSLNKSSEFVKVMTFFSNNEAILSFFSELSKEIKGKYVFLSFSDYEDSLFLLSDFISKNMETLFFYLGKTTEKKICAMYPVFSLVLHNFSKNAKYENAKMLLDYLVYNKMEISTCAINNYIDSLCKSNQLENAQHLFELLCNYKPELEFNCDNFNFSKYIVGQGVNIVTYGTFIKWLCKSNNLDLALYYYQFLKDKNYLKDEIIYNLIIDGCSKKGDLTTIKTVYFDMLNNSIKPTIVTFNTIIDAYIRAKDLESAWKIFEDLLKNNIQPDNFTLSTLFRGIRSSTHKQYLIKGLELVSSLSHQNNQSADVILINVLLDSCIALKESKLIIELFNKVTRGGIPNVSPDLITYNTFIKGCAQMGLYNEVLGAFEDMCNNKKVSPNDVTFNTLIDVFVRSKNMNKVWFIIAKMKEMGIKPDNFTYSTIIKGLNKNTNLNCSDSSNSKKENELDLAFKLFENVKKNSKPDEILYNCIMDACLRFGKIDKMLELYDNMLFEGIKPSSITCGIVIKAYGMQGKLDKALQIYEQMKQDKIEISSVTYGCLINACIKNDNLNRAFTLYEELQQNGFEMNTILYTTLIKAYTKTKNLEKVLEIFNKMKSNSNNLPNNITYNSVIDCCLKSNEFGLADKFFIEMCKSQTIEPDIITFSTLIKGTLRNMNFDKAMDYFEKMLKMKIKPDDVFLNSLLDGCEKLKQFEKAIYIFKTIKSLGVEPTMMSYSIMMKILGKLNNFEYSKSLMEEVKSKNQNLSLIIFTCYIKTCFATGHINEACSTFFSLEKYKICPDAIAYNTIINGITNSNSREDYSNYLVGFVKLSVNQNITLQRHYYISCLKYLKYFKNYNLANELGKFLEENEILKPRKQNNNANSSSTYSNVNNYQKEQIFLKNRGSDERNPLNSIWERTKNTNTYNDETGTNYENQKKYGNNNHWKNNGFKNYNFFTNDQDNNIKVDTKYGYGYNANKNYQRNNNMLFHNQKVFYFDHSENTNNKNIYDNNKKFNNNNHF